MTVPGTHRTASPLHPTMSKAPFTPAQTLRHAIAPVPRAVPAGERRMLPGGRAW
jgi:hypothetical protein